MCASSAASSPKSESKIAFNFLHVCFDLCPPNFQRNLIEKKNPCKQKFYIHIKNPIFMLCFVKILFKSYFFYLCFPIHFFECSYMILKILLLGFDLCVTENRSRPFIFCWILGSYWFLLLLLLFFWFSFAY